MSDEQPLDAGEFSTWLAQMRGALRGEGEMDVPCDGCFACCTASHFVHVAADEVDTLARIPPEVLFPAPQTGARRHLLMGYDENGHCPMLIDGACSIYEFRPRACRTYDCRVYAAAGVECDKPPIAVRVAQWRFRYATDGARATQVTIRAAAQTLAERPGMTASQCAVLAVERPELFAPSCAVPDGGRR